jgi:hypothetical protein
MLLMPGILANKHDGIHEGGYHSEDHFTAGGAKLTCWFVDK